MKYSIFLTMICVTFLAACSTDPIQVDTISTTLPTYLPSNPAPIDVKPIYWTVLNNDVIQALAKKNDPNIVFFALTSDNFSNDVLNLTETIRYIDQQNVNIQFYQEMFTFPETSTK